MAEYAIAKQPARFSRQTFCRKESVSKVWGTGIGADLGWHDIAVGHDARGRPLIAASDRIKQELAARAMSAHITLTDETDHALAFVVLGTASLNLPLGR